MYCGSSCQSAAYKSHKRPCKAAAKLLVHGKTDARKEFKRNEVLRGEAIRGKVLKRKALRGNALRAKVLRGKHIYFSQKKIFELVTHWGPMAPNLLIYICISEVTKQRDNARLRTLVERNQVMQQRRAFGFNSDDAGDDFDDYASTGSSHFPSRVIVQYIYSQAAQDVAKSEIRFMGNGRGCKLNKLFSMCDRSFS